jgi:hypothetical protein
MQQSGTNLSLSWWFWSLTGLALLSGIWLTGLEWLFIEGWFSGRLVYVTPVLSLLATLGIVFGLVFLRSKKFALLKLVAMGAGALVLCVLMFIVEITPVAQGNNDSGEVVFLLIPSTVLLVAYAFYAFSKFRKISTSR